MPWPGARIVRGVGMKEWPLPVDWKWTSIGDAATIEKQVLQPHEMDDHTQYIGLDNIERDTGRLIGYGNQIDRPAKSNKFRFDESTLLYAKLRPYLNKVLLPNFQGLCSTDILVLRPDHNTIDRHYLGAWMRHPLFVAEADARSTGANLPRINPSALCEICVPLPPLETQRKIVAILDKAEEIRRLRAQANELTQTLLQSVFVEMFGDPINNAKKWPIVRLGQCCKIRRGASPRPIDDFLGGDVPWIKIGDCTKDSNIYVLDTEDKIIQEGVKKSVFLKKGSLIFANCGVSLGFARILAIDGCIHDGWLSLEDIDPTINKIYLLNLINQLSEHFRVIAPEGTQPNLNTKIMKEFSIPVPPIKLQEKFESVVNMIEGHVLSLNLSKSEIDELFNSITIKAFTGELVV